MPFAKRKKIKDIQECQMTEKQGEEEMMFSLKMSKGNRAGNPIHNVDIDITIYWKALQQHSLVNRYRQCTVMKQRCLRTAGRDTEIGKNNIQNCQ
jgi:hypothetical protein